MAVKLYDYQEEAVKKMKNGCILCGGVGSGKSITALAYYFTLNGGELNPYVPMDDCNPIDLYIITTVKDLALAAITSLIIMVKNVMP